MAKKEGATSHTAAVVDPYHGEHADSVYAVWHDPMTYDHLRMGPPYLPGPYDHKAVGRPKFASEFVRGPVRKLIANEVKTADAELSGLLQHFVGEYEAMPMAELGALLAYLRGLNFIHWTHHWQTRGGSFYGDHQLFMRLYEETVPMIDSIAERTVGAGGVVLVHPVVQAAHCAAIVDSLYNGAPINPGPEDYVLLSLKGCLRFLVLLRMVYDALDQRGLLTHGTDNLLQGVADKHEEFVYLLKQRSAVRTASDAWKVK